MRVLYAMLLCIACAGCAANEVANFQARPGQQSIMRDGQAALVSRAQNSLVMIRPAVRQFKANSRPVFVVGIYNLSPVPQEFRVANVLVTQTVGQQVYQLAVIPYESLVQEERNRQVAAAVVTGLAAGANAYSAAQSYRNSPTANAIAQANASRQKEDMIDATIQQGQANLTLNGPY
jgi:sRNA-binding protein